MKISYKGAKKKADKYCSLYIRQRDGNRCIVCGSTENLNNGHFISRVFNSTRFDEKNCYCQCAKCNRYHEMNPEPFRKAIVEKEGPDVIDYLDKKSREIKKYYLNDLLEIADDFKKRYEELKNSIDS